MVELIVVLLSSRSLVQPEISDTVSTVAAVNVCTHCERRVTARSTTARRTAGGLCCCATVATLIKLSVDDGVAWPTGRRTRVRGSGNCCVVRASGTGNRSPAGNRYAAGDLTLPGSDAD